jgi:hypothetical protein
MPLPDFSPPRGYRPQSPDTEVAAEQFLIERLRALPSWRKADMTSVSTRAACDLAMVGLRLRHPAASAAELRKRFAALTLGREAAIRLFGWDPERQGW